MRPHEGLFRKAMVRIVRNAFDLPVPTNTAMLRNHERTHAEYFPPRRSYNIRALPAHSTVAACISDVGWGVWPLMWGKNGEFEEPERNGDEE
jgi:hypothetical protein